jgi:NAD(P)-dependent dehydrogenase (short-subunit alcohol dehydrogenase family)
VVGAGQTAGETIGNGRATSLVFAREGARLLLVDRDAESVEETAAMVREEGGEATVHVLDISATGAGAALATIAETQLGRVDILHNNVGIGIGDGPALTLEEDMWDRIMRVNLKAMWVTCKHVIPLMQQQGTGGSVINISSLAATGATPLTAYKVSKAGVNALTSNLALAHAQEGIRVNAIQPGFIDTPMGVDSVAEMLGRDRASLADARARMVPMGRQGTAWDVANAALFLASDESSFITGIVLPVDGGQGARVG